MSASQVIFPIIVIIGNSENACFTSQIKKADTALAVSAFDQF